jgi:CPA1 family monovalent cation:H+ antiporter
LKLWQIAAVTLAGVAYGFFEPGQLTDAFRSLTLYVLLPALLFEGAWNLDYRAMRRQWPAILTLAVPGVAITALIVASALSIVSVPFGSALLAGAILSATDPIAVVAAFRHLPVPRTLRTIVECESLFNDAIAVVLYRTILLVVMSSMITTSDIAIASVIAFGGSIGGIALGIAIAFVAATALRNRKNAGLQIATTILCAYGSYSLGELLHVSGIFAVISSGIALRYFERRSVSWQLAEDVEGFWAVVALFANALVFFLTGAALDASRIGNSLAFVIAALIGVAVARAAVSSLLLPARFPRAWLAVVRIAGLRGALSLALALALPARVAFREQIVVATFAVAIATIVSSTLTVPPVVARAARRPRERGYEG